MLSQWSNTGGSSVGGFPYAKFVLGAQSTLIPTSSAGSPTPTFTRATTATVVDFEGRLVTVPSGAARFQGARFVYNQIPTTTEDFSNAAWTKANVTITASVSAPDGTSTASTATSTAINAQLFISAGPRAATLTFAESWFIRRRTGTGTVWMTPPNNGGDVVIPLTTSWQRVTCSSAGGGGACYIGLKFAVSGDAVDIWHPLLEEVTGQSNQNPSDYVSVGVLSAPYHGAGIDGAKWFTTQNGNTVASNIVSEATGAVIADATLKGYLSEGAGTQILATADIRDMTTANWTLGATMTRARTSVGIDGASNTATRLTGGAVAATNIITTLITAAATSRTYSAYVKRVTGTGIVRISQDNFATNTDITSQLINGSWVLIQLNQTQLNAVMGFKLDTNGDAIDVDCNQFESGAFATSRMLATGAARNADVLTYAITGNISGTAGSVYVEFTPSYSGTPTVAYPSGQGRILDTAGGEPIILLGSGTNQLSMYDNGAGSGFRTGGPSYTAVAGTTNKLATAWGGSSAIAAKDGTASALSSFSGDLSLTGGVLYVASNNSGAGQISGTIRNIRIYNRALSAAQLAAMTT